MPPGKLSTAQQAQLAFLETIPSKLERMHRQIEEMGALRANETQVRSLGRLLDTMRNEAQSLNMAPIADSCGMMAQLTRRGGGLQMRLRGLREGLVSLKMNYEGALKAASRIQDPAVEEPTEPPLAPAPPETGPPGGRP